MSTTENIALSGNQNAVIHIINFICVNFTTGVNPPPSPLTSLYQLKLIWLIPLYRVIVNEKKSTTHQATYFWQRFKYFDWIQSSWSQSLVPLLLQNRILGHMKQDKARVRISQTNTPTPTPVGETQPRKAWRSALIGSVVIFGDQAMFYMFIHIHALQSFAEYKNWQALHYKRTMGQLRFPNIQYSYLFHLSHRFLNTCPCSALNTLFETV